jgi:porphobilinogen synthase
MRALVSETSLTARQLVLPLFVREGIAEPVRVESMPGVLQHTRDSARKAMAEAAAAGVGGVMLYGIPAAKDPVGSGAVDPEGILNVAIADAVAEVGDTVVVMSDLCIDEFTDHGHCGVLDDRGEVDNDATLEIYGRMAVAQASSGAHLLGTSGMMDGQVGAVRSALDEAGFVSTGILAYAVKYASAFYGPFREAVASSLQGDRRAHQQDPANAREAIREALLDVEEGADIVLVKPGLGYLDCVRDVREAVDVPVAAYNVSGEHAMVEAAAARGWIDRDRVIDEIMIGLRRAGADIVLTYWATEVAHRLR